MKKLIKKNEKKENFTTLIRVTLFYEATGYPEMFNGLFL